MDFLIKGIIFGFSIAAPVGPIGILCIRRTLANGTMSGIASGLGTASADAVYGCIAGFGITAISTVLLDNILYLRYAGGIFLIYLGYKTFCSLPVARVEEEAKDKGNLSAYVSAFFLTLTNPMTILSFAAIFVGLGVGEVSGSYSSTILLVVGFFVGSMIWWLFLIGMVNIVRIKMTQDKMRLINKLSGTIIIAFGIISLIY